MNNIITVGISDLNIAQNEDVLVTHALGSCVGICLYDPFNKVAGLSHIMLPESSGFNPVGKQKRKFADLAIPELINKMELKGAKKALIKAKIAGGAQMFAVSNNTSLANIGQRNVIAVKDVLSRLRIPIVAQDTGSNYGRTQYFYSADGTMRIKSMINGEKVY